MHFLPPAVCGSIFSAKRGQDVWRSGGWLARGQVNVADEAKFHSSIHSTFEALVVQCALGYCCGEELDLFCWPMPAAVLQFFMHLTNLLSILLRCSVFTGKAVVDHIGSRPPNSDHDFLWCKFGFGKYFGASSWSSLWADHHRLLYKIHFSMKVMVQWRNDSLLLHRIRDDTSKWWFFPFIFISWRLITLQYCSGFCHTLTWISHGFTCIPHLYPPSHLPFHSSWGTHLLSFFTFPIYFKGIPESSGSKESACDVGDPGSIPGSGRSVGEADRLPTPKFLDFSVTQLVKKVPAMWETWVWSLGW